MKRKNQPLYRLGVDILASPYIHTGRVLHDFRGSSRPIFLNHPVFAAPMDASTGSHPPNQKIGSYTLHSSTTRFERDWIPLATVSAVTGVSPSGGRAPDGDEGNVIELFYP